MITGFKLIVITSERHIGGEPKFINELFEAGLQLLHIRKPDFALKEMEKFIKNIPAFFHSKIVIHSHYELLHNFNLKGAHLPEKARMESDIENIKKIISASFHRLEDLIGTESDFEYVFFSPVFQSISKQGYKPAIELNTTRNFLEENKSQIRFPVIALGGIKDKNILQVKNMGFNGAACIGYIWENSNPVAQFKKLQMKLSS